MRSLRVTRKSSKCHISSSTTPIVRRLLVSHAMQEKLPLKTNSTLFGIDIKFQATPKHGEDRNQFKARVETAVSKAIFNSKHANHELIMCYPTRIAREDEKLKYAPTDIDLPSVQKPIMTGHCLMAYVNEQGEACYDHTISLRPDISKPIVYTAMPAPDKRLPKDLLQEKYPVRIAKHTTAHDEVKKWAEDAYYTQYVHRQRETYPLYCLLRPIEKDEKNQYLKTIREVKATCNRYSIFDHYCPNGNLTQSQNCTIISKVFERLAAVDLKEQLGDNPTPQLVLHTVKKVYFNSTEQTDIISPTDDLCKKFVRA
jgi:hypothetical protein